MKNRLDKLFSDQLSRHEEAPSAHDWDQIHSQLAKNKRILWSKRVGVAATVLIFISIGYFGYHASNNQSNLSSDLVAESIEVTKKMERQSVSDLENKESKKIDFNELDVEYDKESPSIVSAEKIKVKKFTPIVEESGQKKHNPKISLKNEIKIPEKKNEVIIEQQIIQEEKRPETFLTNITEMENSPQVPTSTKPEKSYSQIKIIYKVSKNSKLVEAKKGSYVDRGVNKINKFSEKHLLTEDRKTMLRNTKEDLLALNFGKLFKN